MCKLFCYRSLDNKTDGSRRGTCFPEITQKLPKIQGACSLVEQAPLYLSGKPDAFLT